MASSKPTATDLARAAMDGKATEVARLLALGIDPNGDCEYGGTALIHAAAYGHASIIADLVAAGADVEARTAGGYTSLMIAAEKGRGAAVEALLARGAQLRAKQKVRLALALLLDARPRTTTVAGGAQRLPSLRRRGALCPSSLLARAQHGRTALHLAATAGKLESVRALLAHAAPTEERDDDGYTPLILAGRYGRTDVVKALLAARADVRAEDGAGHKASDAARHGGHVALADLLIEAELG
jgi:ankyrin repeat protein